MASPPSPPKKRTLYDILGVPQDAGAIDIGLAYKARRAALQNSPNADPNEINLVHEAYHVLCLPNERAAYDAKLLTMAERNAAKAMAHADLAIEPEDDEVPAWKRKPVLIGLGVFVVLVAWFVFKPAPKPAAPAPRIVAQRELVPPGEAGNRQIANAVATPTVEKSGEQLFAELSRSTARITVHDVSGRTVGLGSGVVIGTGQVVTNCHVATAGGTLSVKVGGEQFSASVEVADEEYDLCRLSVSGLTAPAVPIGSIDSLKTGQKVYAIGAPQGLELTISDGIVSAFRDMPQGRIIQTTAPISPGSSGGPLFDAYGRLVGIMTFQHRSGQNLNFAVPADWIGQVRSRAATNPLTEAMGKALSAELAVPISAAEALACARTSFPVLAGLPPELAARLEQEVRLMKVPAGGRLFDERTPCGAFPFVIRGQVKVAKLAPSGREIVLYRVEPGQSCLITSSCLLARRDYSATGIAETDVALVAMPRDLFDALMAGSPAFRDYVHSLFADRIGELMALVEEVAFRRLDQRLAAVLLARGPVVAARHQDLAEELGSVREIVSRLLGDFEDRGLVILGRGRVELKDRAGLEALAAGS